MTFKNYKDNKRKIITTTITALLIGLVLFPIGEMPVVNGQTTNGLPSGKTWTSPPLDLNNSPNTRLHFDPALKKAGWIPTPIGYLPHECVIDVGNNATINRDGSVDLANGTHIVPPQCKNKVLPSSIIENQTVSPNTSGWVEYGGVCYCPTSPPAIKYFTGQWTVPPNPTEVGSQIIFLWIGLQTSNYLSYPLIQPVLQWGYHGSYWEIASWFCDPDSAHCYQGPWYQTSVGATINGVLSGTSCNSNGVCLWNIKTTDGTNISSLNYGAYTSAFYWIDGGVLEVSNVADCNQYPPRGSTPTTFNGYYILDTNGNVITPTFSTQVLKNDNCNENVSPSSSTQVSLYYGNK